MLPRKTKEGLDARNTVSEASQFAEADGDASEGKSPRKDGGSPDFTARPSWSGFEMHATRQSAICDVDVSIDRRREGSSSS
jgi:hypothetical protein